MATITTRDMFDEDMASPGHLIGPWMIEEKINSGTYGQVYKARFGGHDEFTASKLYNQTVSTSNKIKS